MSRKVEAGFPEGRSSQRNAADARVRDGRLHKLLTVAGENKMLPTRAKATDGIATFPLVAEIYISPTHNIGA
jgi:hypothetical protein